MGTRNPRRAPATGRTRTRAHSWLGSALVALVLLLLIGTGTTTAAAAEGDPSAPEPTPTEPAPTEPPAPEPVSYAEGIATSFGTWRCSDAVTTSPLTPVLLVHGTGMSATENWATSYAPYLASLGRPVCTVALPAYGTGDVQQTITLVARTIAEVAGLAGRPIDVLGHSQGAYLPRAALRLHPGLVPLVDDVVGLAGVYEYGSDRLTERCAETCIPALHQLAHGSRLLRAVARQPLPAGPSYSNVGSTGDLSITPQPVANTQAGSTAVLVQDVCPGRQVDPLYRDHALIAGDAVAAALVLDALDQDGPVDPARVPAELCATEWYAGFDRDEFMTFGPHVTDRVARGHVPVEPVVGCRLLADCSNLRARGRLLLGTTSTVRKRWVTVRSTATSRGTVAVQVGQRRFVRQVRAGQPVTVRARITKRQAPVKVLTRSANDTTWVPESRWTARRR